MQASSIVRLTHDLEKRTGKPPSSAFNTTSQKAMILRDWEYDRPDDGKVLLFRHLRGEIEARLL